MRRMTWVVRTTVCCIYHKPRLFDESSSESDSDSASDSEPDEGERWRYGDRARRCRHAPHGHGCGHNSVRREGQGGTVHELHSESDLDVNAYERAPKRTG